MEFSALTQRALMIRKHYAELERRTGKEWTREDLVRGFVGDVGDLVKLTMAEDGVRHIEHSKEKLAHELADCLWSVIILADKYEVDLEEAFQTTMDELERKIAAAKHG
jgi:NTP pyrophosphatase (non-canonical NTP hydrolase)